ncbi:MAG: hypothetical protein HYY43_04370 [Deltaproteobacteria bacterium]|nr:hypothetical protein [Deltaproteobacteria bacterium]MBI2342338.1 hypothetical protein [Deltaproteobacteria bacterium]MBI2974804.1 hypothetical protein [Deltaproteobacteria bacterium]
MKCWDVTNSKDFALVYDADKKAEGVQIAVAEYNGEYKGIKMWNDNYSCVGPEIDLLNLTGEERKTVYAQITDYNGISRREVLRKMKENLEGLERVGWFNTGFIDYGEKRLPSGEKKWCPKNDPSEPNVYCQSIAEFIKMRRGFDLMAATAQIVVGELNAELAKK